MCEWWWVKERLDNPRIWRENNGGWVGNKSSQFPSWLAFILSIEKQDKAKKAEKAESAIWSCILILEEPRIRNKSFLGYGWHALTLSGCQLIKLVGE